MIINDLAGHNIVFDTKNRNTELDTLLIKSILSSTICLLATLMNEFESEHYALPCKISKKFRY